MFLTRLPRFLRMKNIPVKVTGSISKHIKRNFFLNFAAFLQFSQTAEQHHVLSFTVFSRLNARGVYLKLDPVDPAFI